MEPILQIQIEQLFSLSGGKPEVLKVILPQLLKTVSKEELPAVGRFLSVLNKLLSELSEEKAIFRVDKRILRALDFMEKNYDRPVKLQDVARHAGLSEGALSRLFRKQTGKTFIDCLNDIRIEHSTDLLRKTDDLISEVAYSCGFSSSRHFTKIFKRKKNITPGTYRKKMVGRFV